MARSNKYESIYRLNGGDMEQFFAGAKASQPGASVLETCKTEEDFNNAYANGYLAINKATKEVRTFRNHEELVEYLIGTPEKNDEYDDISEEAGENPVTYEDALKKVQNGAKSRIKKNVGDKDFSKMFNIASHYYDLMIKKAEKNEGGIQAIKFKSMQQQVFNTFKQNGVSDHMIKKLQAFMNKQAKLHDALDLKKKINEALSKTKMGEKVLATFKKNGKKLSKFADLINIKKKAFNFFKKTIADTIRANGLEMAGLTADEMAELIMMLLA